MQASADRLAALIDIRAPDLSVAGLTADIALAFAGGVALAFVVAMAARLVAWRPPTPWQVAANTITVVRNLPADERAFAFARALSGVALATQGTAASLSASEGRRQLNECLATDFFTGDAGASLAAALYRRDSIDLDSIEHELLRLIRLRGG